MKKRLRESNAKRNCKGFLAQVVDPGEMQLNSAKGGLPISQCDGWSGPDL